MKKILILALTLAACARGPKGDQGAAGFSGADGQNGSDGVSCSVEQLSNGALVTCGDSQAVILNGLDGQDALTGMIGIAAILNPCGIEFNNEEVLLKLSNGIVLALYDGGPQLDRLAVLVPGVEYETTDSHHNQCHFTIDENGDLID